jgi:hypothetical protein
MGFVQEALVTVDIGWRGTATLCQDKWFKDALYSLLLLA